jgi:hypothetical protein
VFVAKEEACAISARTHAALPAAKVNNGDEVGQLRARRRETVRDSVCGWSVAHETLCVGPLGELLSSYHAQSHMKIPTVPWAAMTPYSER